MEPKEKKAGLRATAYDTRNPPFISKQRATEDSSMYTFASGEKKIELVARGTTQLAMHVPEEETQSGLKSGAMTRRSVKLNLDEDEEVVVSDNKTKMVSSPPSGHELKSQAINIDQLPELYEDTDSQRQNVPMLATLDHVNELMVKP